MMPTPNEIARGIRELLRQDIAPEMKGERAVASLRKIMAILRDVDWDDAAFRLMRENAQLEAIAEDILAWIGAAPDARFDDAQAKLRGAVERGSAEDRFAALHQRNLRYRQAIAAFIDAASRAEAAGLTALRQRAAARLVALIDETGRSP
jgi:hypothetical protein